MTPDEAILALGTLILVSCGIGLVFVHSSNPHLKGLHRMGAALVSAGLAAALTWTGLYVEHVFALANWCMLLALVLCNNADQLLASGAGKTSVLGKGLLATQALLGVLQWGGLIGARGSIIGTGILLTVQLESTTRLVQHTWSLAAREPVRFTVGLMRTLAFASLLRGAMATGGLLSDAHLRPRLDALTYASYIAGAVGLGFAFFWRTTITLTSELERVANTDPLTRVHNRRSFLERCEQIKISSVCSGDPFSVLLLDFDHFKSINDRFGHHVGDEVLCAAVERIQDATRGRDVICRWGGEEFAVLLPKANTEGAQIAAERIRANVQRINPADPRFSLSPDAFRVTVSVGGTTYQGSGDSANSMLHRADMFLYQAKAAGRNCVCMGPERETSMPVPARAQYDADLPRTANA